LKGCVAPPAILGLPYKHSRGASNRGDGHMVSVLRELWRDESGVASVEYALLLSVVVLGALGAWTGFGAQVTGVVLRATDAFAGLP
jgi:Flp pilus assembly pilin Flp